MANITYTFGSTFKTQVNHPQNELTSGDLYTTLNNHHDVHDTPALRVGKYQDFDLPESDNVTYQTADVTWQPLATEHVTQQLLNEPILLYPDKHQSTNTTTTIISPGVWFTVGRSISLTGTMDNTIDTHNPERRMVLGTTSNMTVSAVSFNVQLQTDVIGAPAVTSVTQHDHMYVTIQVNDSTQTTVEQLWEHVTQAYYSQGTHKQWTFYVGELNYTYQQ